MNNNRPVVLLTFTNDGAEVLCSRKLRLYKAYDNERHLTIIADYKQNPEGYTCTGSYYLIDNARAGSGLVLETSAGDYQWT